MDFGIEVWHGLIAMGILSFLIEIFTPGFVSGSIGIGFFCAALSNRLGWNIEYQLLAFSTGVLISFFLIRPLLLRFAYKNDHVKTNKDALIGKQVMVAETIDIKMDKGRVIVDGDDWKARSADLSVIQKGEFVRIVDTDSIILIVNAIKN